MEVFLMGKGNIEEYLVWPGRAEDYDDLRSERRGKNDSFKMHHGFLAMERGRGADP